MQVKFQENQIIQKENMGYHWTRKNRSEGTQLRWHRSRKVKITSSDCFLTYDLITVVQKTFLDYYYLFTNCTPVKISANIYC